MKIIDNLGHLSQPTVSSNEIPVGTVFRGRLWGLNQQAWTEGVFYKAQGSVVSGGRLHQDLDHVIVRLDVSGTFILNDKKWANIWITCNPVQNYEPLNVELHILGST